MRSSGSRDKNLQLHFSSGSCTVIGMTYGGGGLSWVYG